MVPKYLVNVGEERLFFDAQRQPFERAPGDELTDPEVSLPVWPVEEELATSSDWDVALASYSLDERESAKIRLIGTEEPLGCNAPVH